MKPTIYVKSVIQIAAIALFLYFLYLVRYMIIYFVIAAVISLVAKPITNKLSNIKIRKWNFPRALSAALTLIFLLGIVLLLNYLLIPQFVKEIAFLSKINFNNVMLGLESEYSALQEFFSSVNIDLSNKQESLKSTILKFFNVTNLTSAFGGILGGLGNVAIATFSVLFMLFFFLKEKDLTHSLVEGAIPDKYLEGTENMIPKIKNTLGRYFRGLLFQMTGIFTLVYIGLKFFAGVEDVLVIAIFAALANLIPYIGPIFGFSFAIIIAIGQAYVLGADVNLVVLALKIMVVFSITQITDNSVFQPVIFSKSIDAHPLEIFIVIAIAGTLFGAPGMIIAVPTYSVLRIFSKEFLQQYKFIRSLTKKV